MYTKAVFPANESLNAECKLIIYIDELIIKQLCIDISGQLY